MAIRPLTGSDLEALRVLAATARAEGFRFLDRLVAEMEGRSIGLDRPDAFFLCIVRGGEIIGVGGVTPDPYVEDPTVGRIRHVYVHPRWRRGGAGRTLIRALERRAEGVYPVLRLRTDTRDAARFYESLGYRAVADATATHVRTPQIPA